MLEQSGQPLDNHDAATTSSDIAVVSLRMRIWGETVSFEVPVPQGPTTWSDLFPFMARLADLATEIGEERVQQQGLSVSCCEGCGACCRQLVPIATAEAWRVARLVDSLPAPRRDAIRQRFQSAVAVFRSAGMEQLLSGSLHLTKDDVVQFGSEYFRQFVACPFLENESCSIHQQRPLSCRDYLVTTPAADCDVPEQHRVNNVPLPLRVSTAAMLIGTSPPGIPRTPEWIPLVFALKWAESRPEPPPANTGPELLKDFLSQLQPLPEEGQR